MRFRFGRAMRSRLTSEYRSSECATMVSGTLTYSPAHRSCKAWEPWDLESSCKRREAAKLRLQAEKAAREQEAEAQEMERMAENLSQTYGLLHCVCTRPNAYYYSMP